MKSISLGVVIGAALSGSFKSTFKNANRSQKELGAAINQTNRRLGQVREAKKYQKQLSTLRKKYNESGKSSKRLEKGIKDLEKRYARASKKVKAYGGDLSKLANEEKKLAFQQERSAKQQRKRNRRRKLGGAARGVGRVAGGGVVLGAAVGTAAFSLVNNLAGRADDLKNTGELLGFNVEAMQEYHIVAEKAGISSTNFNLATQRMKRRISEAAQGMGEAQGALHELGLDAEFLARLSPEKQYEAIADAMAKVPEEDHLRLGFKLFDSEGAKVVNILKDGSKAMAEQRAQARATGGVMSSEMIEKGSELAAQMVDTRSALSGIGNELGQALIPTFLAGAKVIQEFVTDNKAEIKAFGEVVGFVFKIIGRVIGRAFKNIKMVGDAIGKTIGFIAITAGKFGSLFSDEPQYARSGGTPSAKVAQASLPQTGNNVSTKVDAPITIHAAPGMDEEKLAEEIDKKLQEREDQALVASRGLLYDY